MTAGYQAHVVHAFSSRSCSGNPAAVMLFETFPAVSLLQQLAAATQQPVTVMLCQVEAGYQIRWFSQNCEINLCGHGTLAAAAVLFELRHRAGERCTKLQFFSPFGNISVSREGGLYCLQLNAFELQQLELHALPQQLVGGAVAAASSRDLLLEFASVAEVQAYQPDNDVIAALPWHALILTAADAEGGYVLRYLAPKIGIPEDAATGSAHCSLFPYWQGRLGAGPVRARQLSASGGEFVLQWLARPGGHAIQIAAQARLGEVLRCYLP